MLHRLERTLLDREVTGAQRMEILDELKAMRFGASLLSRPDVPALRELLARDVLMPAEVVAARRYLADLNALSSVITRTRKAEIDDGKAVRQADTLDVTWSDAESVFYDEYVQWCVRRADAIGMPVHFCMQMPLRLASACLQAARAAVLGSAEDWTPRDEDDPDTERPVSTLPPHRELLEAAERLGVEVDSKFDQLRTIVADLVGQGKRTLLFTFSRPTLAYLRERLAGEARIAVLHGGVPHDERNRIMAAFRAGDYDLVLANRVASEGLDFEFCSAVINYDLPWNPMEIEQRIGRIDRIGQPEEKIRIVNFYNDETIDEKILRRVLDRIGVFERAIGALEPIIRAELATLEKVAFSFTLTPEEKEAETDRSLTAIEAQTAEAERLAGAAPDLLVSNDVDVSGLEQDLVRAGRYVGQHELAHLVHDWATTAGSPGARPAGRDRIRLRGNGALAEQVNQVVQRGLRSHNEVRQLVHDLREEGDVELLLDQEEARTGGGTLLTATHPLVLAAVHMPEHRQARFAAVRVSDTEGSAPEGAYTVVLAQADATGDRGSREIWGAAVGLTGREAPAGVVDVLLAGLARGDLQAAHRPVDADDLEGPAEIALELLEQRHGTERERRIQESVALADARKVSLREQLDRKLGVIDRRMQTAAQRGRGGRHLFEGQARRARERHEEALRVLDRTGPPDLRLNPLATCYLEIVR
ncbi:helicase-related protein [Pseudonocardia nematodicida]|uniref:Helicase-related protein n=1 Tax=Pseudonocardia nematodicida TaxID=1206997 RepID=A0ABV1KHH2_9PSEU